MVYSSNRRQKAYCRRDDESWAARVEEHGYTTLVDICIAALLNDVRLRKRKLDGLTEELLQVVISSEYFFCSPAKQTQANVLGLR